MTSGNGRPSGEVPPGIPGDVRALLRRIGEVDRSLALVLGGLLSSADDSGAAQLNAIAIAFRDRHLRLVRAEGKDAERESGRLSLDEVRAYLARSVLPRLVRENVIEMPPGDAVGPESEIAFVPGIWSQLGGYRSELAESLLALGAAAVGRGAGSRPGSGSEPARGEGTDQGLSSTQGGQ